MEYQAIVSTNATYPEDLISACRATKFGIFRPYAALRNDNGKRTLLEQDEWTTDEMQDVCQILSFTYDEATANGSVDAMLNLVDTSPHIHMKGTLYDIANHIVLGDLPEPIEVRDKNYCELKEAFHVGQFVKAEDIAVLVTTEWTGQDGAEHLLVLEHENHAGALDITYTHEMPKKENGMIEIDIKDGIRPDKSTATSQKGDDGHIIICFNRTPGFTQDVDYKLNVKTLPYSDKPMFCVPGMGRIKAKGASVVMDPAIGEPPTGHCIVTKVDGGGGIGQKYTIDYPEQVFKKSGDDLRYEMKITWGQEYMGAAGQTKNNHHYDLTITADFLEKSSTVPSTEVIRVTSFDIEPSSGETHTKIPPLQIMWGCLAKGTKVRMADGTLETIENVRIGDQVNGRDGAHMVRNTWRGTEDIIIVLRRVDGEVLKLTRNHPVLCERGWLRAEDLMPGMQIETENSIFMELASVELMTEFSDVFNLDVESMEHLFFAEGFVVGDIEMQNTLI